MKIEVHITDATPEDLLLLFGGGECIKINTVGAIPKIVKRQHKSKYKIPYNARSSEYQKAFRLCRKYNLPYSEALEKDKDRIKESTVVIAADINNKSDGVHWKQVIKNTVNPPHAPRVNAGDA